MALGLRATDRIETLLVLVFLWDVLTSNSISPAFSFKHGIISILIYGPFCKYRSSFFLPNVVCA